MGNSGIWGPYGGASVYANDCMISLTPSGDLHFETPTLSFPIISVFLLYTVEYIYTENVALEAPVSRVSQNSFISSF